MKIGHRKWKGYFSLEASYIMPMVLFLYLLILLAALFLYCRCAISQDLFLLALRTQRFTEARSGYGEIIYGQEGKLSKEEYFTERIQRRNRSYPVYRAESYGLEEEGEELCLWAREGNAKTVIMIRVKKINPVRIIRKERMYAERKVL